MKWNERIDHNWDCLGLSLGIHSLFTDPKGLISSHKFKNLERIPHKPPKTLSLASVISQYIKAISNTLSLSLSPYVYRLF